MDNNINPKNELNSEPKNRPNKLSKNQTSINKLKEKSISKRSNTNHPNKSNSNKISNNLNNVNKNNNNSNINNISNKSQSNNILNSKNDNSNNKENLNNKNNTNNINNNNLQNFNKPSSSSKSNENLVSNISKKKEESIRIEFGDSNPKVIENKKFNNNKTISTKYNVITWAPKSLLIQFRRAANVYFLIITILTSMHFSPKQPGSMIATFCLVLIATMFKEGIEDYYRYTQDRQSNNRLVSKLVNGQWVEVLCWTLRPGDVVKVKKEEEFSADILIIKSTNDTGYCYIDTKNLDGETNLKEKCSLEDFKKISEENIGKLNFFIEVEKPNENLTSWKGLIQYEDREGPFCSLANLILKGSVLKNTKYIIGIVIYSGKDTKIMKNSKSPRMKMSKVLVTMNKLLYSVFAFEIALCLTFAIFSTNWNRKYMTIYTYIFSGERPGNKDDVYIFNVLINFLTFFVAYSHMIPISLYVALEIVKIIQGLLIKYDNEIYDFGIDKPATCRSTDLIEELGQVEFIFSDKTGTLTQNSMILKKVYINGKVYGSMQDEHPETPHSINGDMSIYKKLKNEDANLNKNNQDSDNHKNLKAQNKSNSARKYFDVNKVMSKFNAVNSNKFVGNIIKSDELPNKEIIDIIRKEGNINKINQTDLKNAKFFMQQFYEAENVNANINNEYSSNNKLITKAEKIESKQENVDIKIEEIKNKIENNQNENQNLKLTNSAINQNNLVDNNKIVSTKNLNFVNQIPPAQTTFADPENDKKMIVDFFYLLTLCHACFPELNKEGKIIYQGASPDDIALVKGAQQMGFEYSEKEFSEMTIKNYILNNEKKYDLKVEFPFDSDRKRMSVIVQDKQNKDYSLLSKGADTAMLSRMKLDSAELDEINRVIKVLSKEGLRVLVIGSKQLSTKEYNSWYKHYSEDRNNGKDLNKLYEKMECNLNFMGLTAIEDKLQDGVPDTIYTLLTCNIRVWVLTGDKQDTAEEIAKSCKLINENMTIIYLLNDPNGKSPKEKLRELILRYGLKPESNQYDSSTGKKSALMRNSQFRSMQDKDGNLVNNVNHNNNQSSNNISNINNNAAKQVNLNDLNNINSKSDNKNNNNKFEADNAINKLSSKYQNYSSKEINNLNNNNILQKDAEQIKSGSSWEFGGAEEDELFSEEIIDLEYITKKIRKKEGKDISLIIDGVTLEEILQDKKLSYLFFKISIAAKSVVCCRVSPKQKSKVVQLVKKYGKWVTLSIGDGANDVPMIMEAHIGVGIQGKEGTQAVRSADFSIGQFRFLEKLLLIYGRLGYIKISKFICYYFYKNIILVFTDIFFAFSNGFSGQIYFADYLSTLYNALFTSWPCILTFSFEKDIDLSIIKKFPILYVAGQKNYFFNLKVFWGYIIYAIFHGFICFYIPNLGLLNANDKTGITLNHWYKSTTSFSLVIQIVTFKLMVISDFWNGLNIFSTFASILLYYIILIVFCFKPISVILQNELAGLIFNLFSYPKFWLVILIAPLLALVPDISIKQIFYSVYPTPTEYIKQYLNDQVFLNMVFNDENQTLILNSQQAKDAEKRLQDILKRSRAQKLKKKNLDRNSLENSELPLKDISEFDKNNNILASNDRSRRALLNNPQQIRIRKRKSKNAKLQVNFNNYNKNEKKNNLNLDVNENNIDENVNNYLIDSYGNVIKNSKVYEQISKPLKGSYSENNKEEENKTGFITNDGNINNNHNSLNDNDNDNNHNMNLSNEDVNEKTEENNQINPYSDYAENENEEDEEYEEEIEEIEEIEENEDLSGEGYEEDYSQEKYNKNNSQENNQESDDENMENEKQLNKSNNLSIDSDSNSSNKKQIKKSIDLSGEKKRSSKFTNNSNHSASQAKEINNSNSNYSKKNNLAENSKNITTKVNQFEKEILKEEEVEEEAEQIQQEIKAQTFAIIDRLKHNFERKNTKKLKKTEDEDERSFNSSDSSNSSESQDEMDEINEEKQENENEESFNNENSVKNSNFSRSNNKRNSKNTSKNQDMLFHEESKNEIFQINEVKLEKSYTKKSKNSCYINAQGDYINLNAKENNHQNNFENMLHVKNDSVNKSLISSNNSSIISKQRKNSHYVEFLDREVSVKKSKN